MKTVIAAMAVMAVVMGRPGGAAETETRADFVVAPDGDDASPGTVERPFATFERARDAVRALPDTAPSRDTIVLFRGGVYDLEAPLVVEPRDSGRGGRRVVYAAWPGETPVFSGGVEAAGFVPQADGAWRAKAPPGGPFEHLFVNGRRAIRARYPDTGAFLALEVKEDPKPEGRARTQDSTVEIRLPPEAVAPLAKLDGEALHAVQMIVHHKWDHTRRYLRAVDAERGVVVTRGQQMKPWNPMAKGSLVYFENVSGGADAPGEWGTDGGDIVYRPRPGERADRTEARAARLDTLLHVRGEPEAERYVTNVVFRGLSFLHADHRTPPGGFEPQQASASVDAAVMADGALGVVFTNCVVAHTGAHGIWLRAGCRDCRIDRCRATDLGGGAVRIGETRIPSKPALATHDITVDNNIFHHGGRHFPSACGIWIGHSGTNSVTHNDVGDFYYTGISVGWSWGYGPNAAKANRIANNRVHHIGMGWLSDMGGIYTLGRSEGTRVTGNRFHHVWAHTYGGWGLYTDEGSTGIVFENNIVHDTKDGSFHQHYGRGTVLRNNILAFSRDAQVRVSRADDKNPPAPDAGVPETRATLERNIVIWDTGEAMFTRSSWDKIKWESSSNLWWRVSGPATNFGGRALAEWQAKGREVGSVVADPKFRDAAARDFRLAADSPARRIGFVPFEDRSGVYGDPAWIDTARRAPMPDFANLPEWSK